MAGVKMRQNKPLQMNYWLRGRVLMQGVTVGAIMWTLYGDRESYMEKMRTGKEAVEKEGFEERMKMAEEAHRSEIGAAGKENGKEAGGGTGAGGSSWWRWKSGS
jgi:hypothetical protein